MTEPFTWLIRPFDGSDADFEARVRVTNAYLPDSPTTVEHRRLEDSLRSPVMEIEDWLAEQDGQVVAYGVVGNAVWTPEPHRVWVWMASLPDRVETPEFERFARFLLDRAHLRSPLRIETHVDDVWPSMPGLVQRLGFALEQRNPISCLDLAKFDPAPWAAKRDAMREQGIRMLSAGEFRAEDPEHWIRRNYAFIGELIQDVPAPEPLRMEPFEDFQRHAESGAFEPEGSLIALDGEHLVGRTGIQTCRGDARVGNTTLTGVVRSHRRQGIAAALKVEMLLRARASGMERVFTDNEKDNPMLDLNRQLGFREVHNVYFCGLNVSVPTPA